MKIFAERFSILDKTSYMVSKCLRINPAANLNKQTPQNVIKISQKLNNRMQIARRAEA